MEEIALYGNGCPKCKVLKIKLEKENLNFTESEDAELLEKLGFKSYPVLKVGDKFMNFADAFKWINDRGNENEH